ncbi:hypothetical protein [Methanorbis furvi]|uniref:Uncharacterized protein n=1 Tax=Methanorbis furvi TaxID=3028299 RepID=A0AAE4MCC7_9EURY|nr:hypothetical protein [Methanocorpusculaceae archaeon Ag1]
MTSSKKSSTLLIIVIVILVAACCIACVWLLDQSPASQPGFSTTSPTPTPSGNLVPDISQVPFAIDGHTTILPSMNTDSWDFTKEYGRVTMPEGAKDVVFLTFDKPVASFDEVIALDFTIYGEPYHRILKKESFGHDPSIVTYRGRITMSDAASDFWITFGPGNLVQTDFLWNSSSIELTPIQSRSFTENTTHPLHVAVRQPGWDERMQDPEFANDPWVKWVMEERQKYDDDPNYQPEYYWELYLVNSNGMEKDPGSTIVQFTEEDFLKVPELRGLMKNPKGKVRLSQKTYSEDFYLQHVSSKFSGTFANPAFIEIDGKYYRLGSTTGMFTPWDP